MGWCVYLLGLLVGGGATFVEKLTIECRKFVLGIEKLPSGFLMRASVRSS